MNFHENYQTDSFNRGYERKMKKDPKALPFTFVLPDLSRYSSDFRHFLEYEILEMTTMKRLEESGHLNWWTTDLNQKLWPLATSGDGNCLLHAASLGMYGIHDRQLNLRNVLHEFLRRGNRKSAIYRRWRWQETKNNLQSGLILTEQEWAKEWNNILEMSTATPRPSSVDSQLSEKPSSSQEVYESLENIHVFALANVLKRPIIVVADTILRNADGEAMSPIQFGGIYLPFEVHPDLCFRSPLVLCYDASHFSPLIAMRQRSDYSQIKAVPITDKNRQLLPLQFSADPGPDFSWFRDFEDERIASEIELIQTHNWKLNQISRYMDIVRIDLRRDQIKKITPWLPLAKEVPDSVNRQKYFTLATSGIDEHMRPTHHKNSNIFKEIRSKLKKLSRKDHKNKWLAEKSATKMNQQQLFSADELILSNSVLCALICDYQHQQVDAMLDTYISEAKKRFEQMRMNSLSRSNTPKIRISHSFSNSGADLKCLECQKIASPSTNFLCEHCFDKQQHDFESNLTNRRNGSVATTNGPLLQRVKAPPPPPIRSNGYYYRIEEPAFTSIPLSKSPYSFRYQQPLPHG